MSLEDELACSGGALVAGGLSATGTIIGFGMIGVAMAATSWNDELFPVDLMAPLSMAAVPLFGGALLLITGFPLTTVFASVASPFILSIAPTYLIAAAGGVIGAVIGFAVTAPTGAYGKLGGALYGGIIGGFGTYAAMIIVAAGTVTFMAERARVAHEAKEDAKKAWGKIVNPEFSKRITSFTSAFGMPTGQLSMNVE